MSLETPLVQEIRLDLGGRPDVRLFRNNVGLAQYPDGSKVAYGLCPGSSDLIGWRSVTVTPEMVGSRVAVFLAVEVKAPGGYTKPQQREAQRNFIEAVRAAGGLAGHAESVEEARAIAACGTIAEGGATDGL